MSITPVLSAAEERSLRRPWPALLLAAVFLCGLAPMPARAQHRQFFSSDKAYCLSVKQTNKRGRAKSYFELSGPGGRKISAFTRNCYTVQAFVPDSGLRLVVQCGFAGRMIVTNEIVFFDASGKALARHDLNPAGNGGQAFSADGSSFVYGYQRSAGSALCMFDMKTGRKRWERSFESRFNGFKLAAQANNVFALTGAGNSYTAFLFDSSGRELGRAEVETNNSCKPEYISVDGTRFAVTETMPVNDPETGYMRFAPVRRHRYLFYDGRVTEEQIETLNPGETNQPSSGGQKRAAPPRQ